MTDYNAMLIDLLNEKIKDLINDKVAMRKEIKKLKAEKRANHKRKKAVIEKISDFLSIKKIGLAFFPFLNFS